MRSTIHLGIVTAALAATVVWAANPQAGSDDDWITLTGKVMSTTPDRFTVDYGEGRITVEMDDWDWRDEAAPIANGDWVTVRGRIDDGLYERRTIEATSVYVAGHNTYYYASAADEEGDLWSYPYLRPFGEGTWLSLTGTVASESGREFVLDLGASEVRVDTDSMAYDPLDDEGLQRVDEGDRVAVTGTVDVDFFESRELDADTIVTLSSARAADAAATR